MGRVWGGRCVCVYVEGGGLLVLRLCLCVCAFFFFMRMCVYLLVCLVECMGACVRSYSMSV